MDLPKKAEIVEVGPRDGLQNIEKFIPTEKKVVLINKLIDANIKEIEITGFVHPKWVPQMKDAAEVVERVKDYAMEKNVKLVGLIPNLKGAQRAVEIGVKRLTYTISASDKYSIKNVNKTTEEALSDFESVMNNIKGSEIKVVISASFGSPFEGESIPIEKIIGIAKKAKKLGAYKIILADTVGLSNPIKMREVLRHVKKEIPSSQLGLHLHDTRGMGLASTYVALEEGVTYFESSIGGLGGSPFAPNASGNIPTEDLVNMLESMDVDTGINLEELLKSVRYFEEELKLPVSSYLAKLHS